MDDHDFFRSRGGVAIAKGPGDVKWNFGRRYDPAATAALLATLPNPTADDAAAHLAGTGEGKNVFGWTLEEKLFGKRLPPWDQSSIGSCVSHGTGRAVQDVLLAQVALGAEEWPGAEVCREAIYGGSRVEVGGERGSYSDGSVGAWAAKWVNNWGVILYQKYGAADLSGGYSVSRCKEWGARGCPDDLEPEAKAHPVRDTTLVTSPEQCRDLIANLHFVAICGSKGRTMKRRPGGWCPVSGSWAHSQELRGTCQVAGSQFSPWGGDGAFPWAGDGFALVYQNSWGDYLGSENNRVKLADGSEVELPAGCYLSHPEEIESELRQEDTFAFASAVGWARQTIPWIF
jgi:hypothetical protein